MGASKMKAKLSIGKLRKEILIQTDLNFAVPSVKILREFCPFGDANSKPRKPCVYIDIMEKTAELLHDTSVCLTFDGEKIKQGLTTDSGDVDFLRFEEGLSLKDRQKDLTETLKEIQTLLVEISDQSEDVLQTSKVQKLGLL